MLCAEARRYPPAHHASLSCPKLYAPCPVDPAPRHCLIRTVPCGPERLPSLVVEALGTAAPFAAAEHNGITLCQLTPRLYKAQNAASPENNNVDATNYNAPQACFYWISRQAVSAGNVPALVDCMGG
nr:unnamed protein product [Digitaria exilis]